MHRGGHRGIATLDEGLEAALELAALDQDMPIAGPAAEADVSSEPIHSPLAPATRMRAPEPNDVAEQQLQHGTGGHGPGAYQRRG